LALEIAGGRTAGDPWSMAGEPGADENRLGGGYEQRVAGDIVIAVNLVIGAAKAINQL
jgi:hypothetical protein